MKIHLKYIKPNDKFFGANSNFVDSGFVKTSDELVIGRPKKQKSLERNQWQNQMTLLKKSLMIPLQKIKLMEIQVRFIQDFCASWA